MLLHDLSWIPIFVQSFISISYLGFEIRLLKLNNNNNKKFENWLLKINQVPIMRLKPFLGYMLFVTIRISQKLDLIETATPGSSARPTTSCGERVRRTGRVKRTNLKCVPGHNAGQPSCVIPLSTTVLSDTYILVLVKTPHLRARAWIPPDHDNGVLSGL